MRSSASGLPITVSASETILAFAGAPGYTNSTVGSAAYAIYPYGVITTIAGNGIAGYSGDGGAATSAEVNLVEGVTADGSGNVYFADIASNCVRKITGGVITTVAGTGTQGFSGDGGAAISAQLFHPQGVAIDGNGNLYIVDTGNYRIRKVTPAGIISTIAGNGTNGSSGDGAAATSAQLLPTAIAVDGVGNLYIGDANHERIRMVTLAGTISTIAGNGTAGFTGDGGAATSAELNEPQGVAVDPTGNVYIADFVNHRIRKVTPAGVISTFAGNGTVGSGGDGGAATSAALQSPLGVFADNQGNLYLADATGSRIREVNTSGIISTVAGTGTQGFGGDGERVVGVGNVEVMDAVAVFAPVVQNVGAGAGVQAEIEAMLVAFAARLDTHFHDAFADGCAVAEACDVTDGVIHVLFSCYACSAPRDVRATSMG